MRTEVSEWVFLSPIDFGESETRKIHQSAFRILPSPYSMPSAMRVVSEPHESWRSLELKYLSSEPMAKGTFAEESEIEFGRKTLRPRVIRVRLESSATIAQFIRRVDAALDSFMRVHSSSVDRRLGKSEELRLSITISTIKALLRKYQESLAKVKLGDDDV